MTKLRKAKIAAQKAVAKALAQGKSPTEAKKLGIKAAQREGISPAMLQLLMAFLMKLLEGWLKI